MGKRKKARALLQGIIKNIKMDNKQGYQGPKSLADELRRMPVDFQRRVSWTLRISAAWFATILFGAGVFIMSKPYMDRKREEKIKSGEFFKELAEAEKPYSHTKRSWEVVPAYNKTDKEAAPPGYLLDVISDVLKDEKEGKMVAADVKKATNLV